jgi:hypothetical protein
MQIVVGCVLLIACGGMIVVARPAAGQDSVVWLSKPWFLGQAYVLATLVVGVVAVSFILNGWPT